MALVQRAVDWIYAGVADSFYKKFRQDTLQAGEVNREALREILSSGYKSSNVCYCTTGCIF